MSHRHPLGTPSIERLTVGLGLTLMAAVGAVLALVAWQWTSAARAREQAGFALRRVQRTMVQTFQGQAFNRGFRTWRHVLLDGSAANSPDSAVTLMRAAGRRPPPDECWCGSGEPTFVFAARRGREPAVYAFEGTLERARSIAGGVMAGITSTGRDAGRMHVVPGLDGAGEWLVHYITLPEEAGVDVLGMGIPLDRLAAEVFAPTFERVMQETQHPGADSLFRLVVRSIASDRVLYASSTPVRAESVADGQFWGDAPAAFSVTLAATAAGAGVILPGGIPRIPKALLGSLAVLALGLIGVGALFLTRTRQLVRARESFTSSVTHELRTPLTQILLFAETLQLDDSDPARRQRATGVIVRETRRLIHLIENVLSFVRGRHSTVRLDPTVQPLAPLVAAIVRDLEPVAATREARLRASLAPDVSAEVDADALRQVLVNLIDNAVRYGPVGQTIDITLRAMGDVVELAVVDRGPGVPADDRERIWAPYVRLEPALRRETTGTGIGLAIVRQLVELHGGRCRVEDAWGGGARFVVELPAVMSPAAERVASGAAPSDRSTAALGAGAAP